MNIKLLPIAAWQALHACNTHSETCLKAFDLT